MIKNSIFIVEQHRVLQNIPYMSHLIGFGFDLLNVLLFCFDLKQVQALCLIEVCLKESHLKRSDNISLEHYSMYNTHRKEDESGTGGLTLLY
jgi:hypothetical protein